MNAENNNEATTGQGTTGTGTNHRTGNSPSQFDWVTERSSCTLPKVFNTLRSQVEEDVRARNSLRPNNSPYEFALKTDTTDFKVLLIAKELEKSVTFSLADNAIQVRDDQGNLMFEVPVTFDDSGNCRLNVNGEERDFWQVRRIALEDLMYRGL